MKFLDETARHARVEIEHKTHYQEIRDDEGIFQPPSFEVWSDIVSQETLIHRYDGENNLIDTIKPELDEKTGKLYQMDIGDQDPHTARHAIISIFVNGEPRIVGIAVDRRHPHKENQ